MLVNEVAVNEFVPFPKVILSAVPPVAVVVMFRFALSEDAFTVTKADENGVVLVY